MGRERTERFTFQRIAALRSRCCAYFAWAGFPLGLTGSRSLSSLGNPSQSSWRDSQTSALLDHVVQAEGAPHARVVVEEGKDVLRRGGGVMARAGTRLTPAPAPLPALVVHEEAVRQKHLAAPYGATPPRVVGQKAGSQRGEPAALVVRRRGTKNQRKSSSFFQVSNALSSHLISLYCESWHPRRLTYLL